MKPAPFAAAFLFLLMLAGFSGDSRAEVTSLSFSRQDMIRSGASYLSLNFEISAASITFRRSDDNETAVQALVTYEAGQPPPVLSLADDNGTFRAFFSSGYDTRFTALPQVQQWLVTIGSFDTAIDLSITCGGVQGELELGGLPLRSCSFVLGAADLAVAFSEPATRPVEIIMVAGTGMRLDMGSLGNTDFGVCGILGSAGTVSLDLSGALSPGSHAVTLIELKDETAISMPPDVGASITSLAPAASVQPEGTGWQTRYRFPFHQGYITEEYPSQDVTIDFDITAFGSSIIIEKQ